MGKQDKPDDRFVELPDLAELFVDIHREPRRARRLSRVIQALPALTMSVAGVAVSLSARAFQIDSAVGWLVVIAIAVAAVAAALSGMWVFVFRRRVEWQELVLDATKNPEAIGDVVVRRVVEEAAADRPVVRPMVLGRVPGVFW
ncbi:hypothetical protein [Mycolicibacterium llatzerense]|uniref:hypothetical protein n=1 Tax=Mycolicibacterium llatzerense TaxID=280871 RepID=UPI0008DEA694|nr:hypothetical protein [Mycolicibacterium llatzerense]